MVDLRKEIGDLQAKVSTNEAEIYKLNVELEA